MTRAPEAATTASSFSIVLLLLATCLAVVCCGATRQPADELLVDARIQQQQQQQQLLPGQVPVGGGRALINGAGGEWLWGRAKRARKMSAFMPMRGRRKEADLASAFRENEAEPSIIRLVSGAGSGALHWLGPRQFASQLALRNQPEPSAESVYEFAGAADSSEPAPKLRRAFHPMRGKKSHLELAPMTEAEALALLEELDEEQ